MGWRFLYQVRQTYHSSDPWGTLFMAGRNDTPEKPTWEKLCYTYELPWVADKKGKSKPKKSRIDIGTYEMKIRVDGKKGWRLELLGTVHRAHIQLHRAHKSLYIEGCILPVSSDKFAPFPFGIQKDSITQFWSELYMDLIRYRYEHLARIHTGNPTIEIAAKLPASITPASASAIA